MTRARALLLGAAAIVGTAGLAACDATSTVAGPRPNGASRATGSTTTTTTMTMSSDTTLTCRSGYQIAYRADGTAYCAPQDQ